MKEPWRQNRTPKHNTPMQLPTKTFHRLGGGLLLASLLPALPVHAGDSGKSVDKTPVAPVPADVNPLSFADGRVIFDFEERLRFEYRDNNFDFNSAKKSLTDDSWLLERTRVGVAIKPASWFKIYVQGQDTREFGSDRPKVPGVLGAEGNNAFDFRQAYIQIGEDKGLSLTAGRQVLSYGDERVLGPLDWNNFSRTWDAAKLRYVDDKWSLDAFAGSLVNIEPGVLDKSDLFSDKGLGRDQVLSGLYFSTTALPFQTTDLYALFLHEKYTTGDSDFATLGTRWKSTPGALGPWDYDAEFVTQTGKVKGKDLASFAGHIEGGYTFEAPWKPRFALDYDYGSGDGNAKDGKVTTFQNLYPTNHLYYGYMDVFSWQNIHDVNASFKVSPCKTVTAKLDYHVFWLADTADAWYRANGTTAVRPISPGASNFAGSELDLTLAYAPKKWLSFQAGYSHFFAGSYLKDTGAHSDADFVYTQMTVKF